MIKKQIPNIFTLLNLLSGVIAILMALSDKLVEASFFVILGIFFDFFDGFFARMFKVQGEFGKQLDSLADVVTSGVAPGFIMFQLLLYTTHQQWFMEINREIGQWSTFEQTNMQLLPFIGFLIPLASAFRLAKFNIDERQTDSFLGLPTPAFALFVVSLPLILHYSDKQIFIDMIINKYVLIAITIIGSFLLNVELSLFSLKFKNYSLKDNLLKYFFLIITLSLIITLKTVAIPLIIIVYILLSIFDDSQKKTPIEKNWS